MLSFDPPDKSNKIPFKLATRPLAPWNISIN